MIESLRAGLSSRRGLVRKGSALLLRVPRAVRARSVAADQQLATPAVFVNSFPKSGTHLLSQLVAGLPDRAEFGTFLASMTSSYRFRERTAGDVARMIQGIVPGETVRGHLFYDPLSDRMLCAKNIVHYFIYRDPRDVVVSEAHYLREMNRWHRLHPYFRKLESMAEAIKLSITGFERPVAGIDYPNIAERFARYRGWLDCDDCMDVRFEDLISDRRPTIAQQMAHFYAERSTTDCDVHACVRTMLACVAPHKSHTFRSGKKAGWKREFNAEHRRLFDEVAGELLVELGYEPGRTATRAAAAPYVQASA